MDSRDYPKPLGRSPIQAALDPINRLMRADRRRRLAEALSGSAQDRWAYCLGRVLVKPQVEAVCFGSSVFDAHAGARQALRHYTRLTEIAERAAGIADEPLTDPADDPDVRHTRNPYGRSEGDGDA